MDSNKVWFITGAGRGMGADITKAALASGYKVVATGRNTGNVARAIGKHENCLIVKLDVTSATDAKAAVNTAVEKFGRIDVLVNNAANFYAGFFEELTIEQIEGQLQTSLIGPMKVTRAVLPVMRKQKTGHIISISSTGGLTSFEFCSAYSAAKFGMEGWMQALQAEVAPFGILTTIVNPGFFRTELLSEHYWRCVDCNGNRCFFRIELLSEQSTNYADKPIGDYDERRKQQMGFWKGANGQQSGDPAKLAQALTTIAGEKNPPLRFIAGADAIGTAEQVASRLLQQTNAYRALSGSLDYDTTQKANDGNRD